MQLARIPPNKQIVPLPIAAPGSNGLNLQQAGEVLQPVWLTEAMNAVISPNGLMSQRGSLIGQTNTASNNSGPIGTIFEWVQPNGTYTTIYTGAGSLSSNAAAPFDNGLYTSGVGAVTGYVKFSNFNGKVIGIQAGSPLIVASTGTSGKFVNVTVAAGTAPTGGIGTAAYGRLWILDGDGHTIKWCALLDETTWSGGDSGSLDMAKVWPLGGDTVTAIEAFNGTLAIFGTRQIIFYGSTDPTVLGLDVTQLTVVDQIEGTGCISQRTVAHVGTADLMFLSPTGIQSLGRLLINRSRPTAALSKYVRDALIGQVATEDLTKVTGFYSPTSGFYALCLPVSSTVWVADTRRVFQDDDGDTVSRMTRWNTAMTAGFELHDRSVHFSNILPSNKGNLLLYLQSPSSGGFDVSVAAVSTPFTSTFTLPWLDFGDQAAQYLKALKHVGGLFFYTSTSLSGATTPVSISWSTDFSPNALGTVSFVQPINLGPITLPGNVPASGTGQYFSVTITVANGGGVALQALHLTVKLLRLSQ